MSEEWPLFWLSVVGCYQRVDHMALKPKWIRACRGELSCRECLERLIVQSGCRACLPVRASDALFLVLSCRSSS